jgi:hypothetical protein
VRLTNAARAPLEGEIRAGSSDRYAITPPTFRLRPGESLEVVVNLKLLRFGQRQKAAEQGQRDWFTVKLTNFPGQDQRFFATFFLDPSEAPGSSGDRQVSGFLLLKHAWPAAVADEGVKMHAR